MLPRLNLIAMVGAVAFHRVAASTSMHCISEIHVEVATLLMEYPVVISASVAHPTTWTVNDQITLTITSATDLCLTTASTKTVVETKTLFVSSIDSASNGIATAATSPATSSSWEYSQYVSIATSYGIDPSQTSKTRTRAPLSSGGEIAPSTIGTTAIAGFSVHTTRPDQGHITPTGPALAASAPASSAEDSKWNVTSIVSPLSGTGMSTSSEGLVVSTSTGIAAPLSSSSSVSGSFQAFGSTDLSTSTSSPSPTTSTMTTSTIDDSHTSSTLLFQSSTDLSGIPVTSNDTRPSTKVPAVTSTIARNGTSLGGINMTVSAGPFHTDPQAGPSSAGLSSSTCTTSRNPNVTRSITTTVTGATAGTSIIPATGTIPDTVIVTYVSPTPTTTTIISGTDGFTTTLAATGSDPATVIVDVPSPTARFTCDPRGYLIQTVNNNAALYSVNITTGVVTTITSAVSGGSGGINAIGFNVFDNNLYGTNSTGAVLRITTAGKTEFVTQLPQHSYFNSADVDTNGQYWVSEDGEQWYQIDLLPGSSTYGQVVDSGVSTVPSGLRLIDWVYLPGQGNYLWATAYNTGTSSLNSLLKWSMTAHTWTVVTDYTKLTGEFGAVYGASNGTFWGSRNSDGYIYRFVTAGDAPVLTSSGPVSNLNDGARCVLAALT